MLSELTMAYAKSFLLLPYIWGGQSHDGVDCSGYVIMVLQAEGILPNGFDASSQGLYNYFTINGAQKTKRPHAGCLAFYGKDVNKITHVALCMNDRQVIEAAGGGSSTKTHADAVRDKAHVRVRPVDYRKDLVAILTTDVHKVIPLKK